ncbi:Tat pathway signal sequence domain protein [Croceibacterium sp. TMG7-5b_MA50]|uniref:exo-rhamnogalacturonan lyase family protein n=1 Tax=Croceibacterium sp. TMG7-5b_MA50 TaxID=3121290 RepID=UPI003221E32B
MPVTRRRFVQSTALATCAAFLTDPATLLAQAGRHRGQALRWLDGAPPATHEGVTTGAAWPRGTVTARSSFAATAADGSAVPVQSWVTATWPDGSVKWTAHAFPGGIDTAAVTVGPGRPAAPARPVRATRRGDAITVTNGDLVWTLGTTGQAIIRSARRSGTEVLGEVALTASTQTAPDADLGEGAPLTRYDSLIQSAEIEHDGPVRATIRVSGMHQGNGREWLPFTLRLHFHAGSPAVRIQHTFVFDGNADTDFIRGLGLTGQVPMMGATHDRHVRFAGSGDGIWAEAVRPLTGLRRDPGEAFRQAQVAGRATPPLAEMADSVRENLQFIPEWGDFTLSQPNADGFTIVKRTKTGHGWIDADGGERARGLGYVGGPRGGVAFGQQDFWQRCPVRLDIRDAATDTATFRLWYHAPDAPAMDLRFYHDEMGMGEFVEQNRGLDVTYEDYEPGWGSAHGIAHTTEFTLYALPATPTAEMMAAMAHSLSVPPRLVPEPASTHAANVFGDWSLPDRSVPAKAAIEAQNDFLLSYYEGQVEQRRWYGFWSHGDWMHTYDRDRHVWRYDIGGFAWANSELSPDLWLWYSYLRSGDAKVFRLAEAMTRHTGEVDTYHLGPWKGLGTRHGVQHWGDSSKQPRVSNAVYRRIYYYLTADERTGDILRECLAGDEALTRVDIARKVGARPGGVAQAGSGATVRSNPQNGEIEMSFGTSWGAMLGAWLAEWERTGDRQWRDRIVNGMTTLAALPKQWFAGGANFDLATGRFTGPGDEVSVSHLNAVFGAVEINSELLTLVDVPAYRRAWLDYCIAYNASPEQFEAMTGERRRPGNLGQGHSRLTAYAANALNDPALADRAWAEFYRADAGLRMGLADRATRVEPPAVLNPVDEQAMVSTNGASQWGLAAIQNLALVGDRIPRE